MINRNFISEARRKRPIVPPEVATHAVNEYVQLRRIEHEKRRNKENLFTYTTPRCLLGVFRLAQALARIKLNDTVAIEDINEALRLMEVSKSSLLETSTEKRRYDSAILF